MNEWQRYNHDPLDPDELQRVRMNEARMEEIYPIFGPLAQIIRNWKYLIAILAVVIFLTSDRGRAILSAIAEVMP